MMVSMGRIVTFPALTIVEAIHATQTLEPVIHAVPASMEVNAVVAVHTIVTKTNVKKKMVLACRVNLAFMGVNVGYLVQPTAKTTFATWEPESVSRVILAFMGINVRYLVQPTANTTFVTKNMGPALRVNQASIRFIVILHAPPTVKTTDVTFIMEHVLNANLDGQEQLAKQVSVRGLFGNYCDIYSNFLV